MDDGRSIAEEIAELSVEDALCVLVVFTCDVTLLLVGLLDIREENEAEVEVIALVSVVVVVVVVVAAFVVDIKAVVGGRGAAASVRVVEVVRPPFRHC